MANESKSSNKNKTIVYTKTAKLKSFLQSKLQKALENYSDTPECFEELDKISRKLASLDLIHNTTETGNQIQNSCISSQENHFTKDEMNKSSCSSFQKFKNNLEKNPLTNASTDRFQNYFSNSTNEKESYQNLNHQSPDNHKKIKTSKKYSKNSNIQNSYKNNENNLDNKNIEAIECTEKESSKKKGPLEFIKIDEKLNFEDEEQVVEDRIHEIRETLRNNSVLLVQGNTGCGKTTKIPRFLMDEYSNIVCTQPRRLAAINVASKVASDLGCSLGSTVGYSIRFEDLTSNQTKLKFVTDGILVNEIASTDYKKAQKIAGYDLIIIDEAHERSMNIDFLLGCIKKCLISGFIQTKLLIMSATINSEKFAEFFNCPVISIKHKMFPLEHFYLKEDDDDYLNASIKTTLQIVEAEKSGDVLVFLTGQDEIEKAYYAISSAVSGLNISVLKLYSTMPHDEQDLVFKIKTRKIVLSTNIAETSITIENVKFVVDCGKFKCKSQSKSSPINYLEIQDISHAQAKQRAGRAGRTQPGFVYRMYSYEKYLSFNPNPVPEVLRLRLSSIILSMKGLGIEDVYNFEYIDKPSINCINSAEETLYYLRAINFSGAITKLGKKISKLPMAPEMALSLYAANKLGCLNSVATIAAFLEFQTPFLDIKNDNPLYGKYKFVLKTYSHPKGDFYTFLAIFRDWKKSKFSAEFLRKNFLSYNTMTQIQRIRAQVLNFFPDEPDTSLNIEEAFSTGFFMNIAKIDKDGYRTIFGDINCFIHPKDGLYRNNSKLVLFIDLQCSKKRYMRHCIEIEPYILRISTNSNFNTSRNS